MNENESTFCIQKGNCVGVCCQKILKISSHLNWSFAFMHRHTAHSTNLPALGIC